MSLSRTLTVFRPIQFSGYRTGALDIQVAGRRVLSIPSQLGCAVGCTFCISSRTQLVRSLKAKEMLTLVRRCLEADAPDGRPMELSFTGEGEPIHNWKAAAEVCGELGLLSPDFDAVRYSFSGLGAPSLLSRLSGGSHPVRLQFSLHSARQLVRDRLVPHSARLDDIQDGLVRHAARFSAIELNVVLQDGLNDTDDDLEALIRWGDPSWPVLLNPLLQTGCEQVAARTELFASELVSAGRCVKRYSRVGAQISRQSIYPLMTATRTTGITAFSPTSPPSNRQASGMRG